MVCYVSNNTYKRINVMILHITHQQINHIWPRYDRDFSAVNITLYVTVILLDGRYSGKCACIYHVTLWVVYLRNLNTSVECTDYDNLSHIDIFALFTTSHHYPNLYADLFYTPYQTLCMRQLAKICYNKFNHITIFGQGHPRLIPCCNSIKLGC